jgi:hypothetical protein
MKLLGTALAVCVCLHGVKAGAASPPARTTAAQLYALCNSERGSDNDKFCGLYMSGFASGTFTALTLGPQPAKRCVLPDYFNGNDLRAIFDRFMKAATRENQIASTPAHVALFAALSVEYPCLDAEK